MRRRTAFLFIALAVWVLAGTGVDAGGPIPEFRGAGSTQNTLLSEPCPADQFPPIDITFASLINQKLPGTKTNIRCITEIRRQGEPVRGVPIMLGGDLIDGDGNAVASLPTRSGTTNKAGQTSFTFPYSVPPPGSQLGVIMEGFLEGDLEIDSLDTTCSIVQRERCKKNDTTACLAGKKRFKVEVNHSDGKLPGMVLSSSKEQALFYFFSPGSSDLLVQLLDRCRINDHFWVFANASTNVPFDLTVTDTFNGEARAYTNPGPLEPILDTAAFATCP